MRIKRIACFLPLLSISLLPAKAQDESAGKIKVYGNVTNYCTYDTRECYTAVSGIYNIGPKDVNFSDLGSDLNDAPSVRFISVATRLGVDWNGFTYKGVKMDAKVEADFCSNVNGGGVFRLRDAYMKGSRNWGKSYSLNILAGQTRHPMAKDYPSVLSLSLGAPFNAYNFSPQLTVEGKFLGNLTATASLLWQMQYASTGPEGVTNSYMNYGSVPETYVGLGYSGNNFKMKLGGEMLSIRPRIKTNYPLSDIMLFVNDRITTFSGMAYAEYTKGLFSFKAKSIFSQAGEHLGLMSGYAVSRIENDVARFYTPYQVLSSWLNVGYGNKLKFSGFLGYMVNFGTPASIIDNKDYIYFACGAWNINRMCRAVPSISYSMLKDHFTVGLEYEMTGAQYGDTDSMIEKNGLAEKGLGWVFNHRVELVVSCKF